MYPLRSSSRRIPEYEGNSKREKTFFGLFSSADLHPPCLIVYNSEAWEGGRQRSVMMPTFAYAAAAVLLVAGIILQVAGSATKKMLPTIVGDIAVYAAVGVAVISLVVRVASAAAGPLDGIVLIAVTGFSFVTINRIVRFAGDIQREVASQS